MNKSESKYYNTAVVMDEALLLILENKDYEFITVKEICQKAGVNRSTFYLHYESMNDLLEEAIEMINQEFYSTFNVNPTFIQENIKSKNKDNLILITSEYLTPYLKFVYEHKKLFKLAISKPYLLKSVDAFSFMNEKYFAPIMSVFGIEKDIQTYMIKYYLNGIIAIVNEWLKNDCDKSIEEIIDIIFKCIRAEQSKV